MRRVLLTGATGFIGRPLAIELVEKGFDLVACARHRSTAIPESAQQELIGDISAATVWAAALDAVSTVIHAAARVHVMHDSAVDPLAEFRRVNVDSTINLAKQSAAAGVTRFIFLSSIKVNGEETQFGKPFTADDSPAPQDAYAISKSETERALLELAVVTGMEVVIIRPVLVYGPEVKANFLSMIKWLYRSIPLPLGAVHNKRSLVALDNLVSFIIRCIDHPKAANEIFLISDGEDVSTTELLQKVAKALEKKAWLIPIPVGLMKSVANLLGKGDVADRLFGSLQVDSSKARELLGWKPVISMDDELKKTADAYLNEQDV